MRFQQMLWNMNMEKRAMDYVFTAVSNTQSTTMPAAATQRYSAQQRNATPNRLPKAENRISCFLPFLF
jgi:hypothetical protein